MADNSKHHPQRLRTFASDMQAVRGEQEHPAEKPPVKEVVAAAPIPVASAPKPTKPIVRKPLPPIKVSTPTNESHKTPTLSEISHNKTATNKIPAFHELQKSVTAIREDITAEPVKKPFHQKKEKQSQTPAARPNIGFDATVITDTKSDRFKLFPSLIESISSWFKKLVTDSKRKKAPKYTIPEAERRKGVIQRATSKTGTIFTADSETLKEQIRRRRQQEELEDEAETFWTPFTETGFSLLEAPDLPASTIQNVSVTYKNQPSLQPRPSVQQPLVTPEAQTVSTPEPTLLPEETPITEEVTPDPLTTARWEASQEYDGEEQLVVPETTEDSSDTPPTEDSLPTPRTGLFTADTNTLTVIALLVILGLVAIVFAARIIITKINEVPEKTSSVEIPTEPLLPAAKLVGVPLTVETLNQLPDLVHSAIASSTVGLVEYAVVSAVGDEVSASYLFEILGFQTTPHLRQSITAARFATVNRLEPALVLQFTDTDAVRGGLLAWEATMVTDILPLYAASETIPAELSFTDEKISGFDVRVLRHDGSAILIYGIVGSNTALIAPNTALFAQLVELGLAQ
jgi:hypothetical protein